MTEHKAPPDGRRGALISALAILLLAAAAWTAGLLLFGVRVETRPATPEGMLQPEHDTGTDTGTPAEDTRPLPPLPARALTPGKTLRDCATCPEMVEIPPGRFDMGEPPDTHRVTLAHAFALGRYEVTQREWRAVMGSDPAQFRGDDRPVERVSWDDVQAFIARLNRKTGQHYRLPSEAEWEYACRAGGVDDYCGGADVDRVAWYGALGDKSGGNSGQKTHAVGGKQPNALGLYDMSGNVWEWVADPWHPGYAGAPADGSVWAGDGTKRVIRGGSWRDYPLLAGAGYRVYAGRMKRSSDLGFRLARDLQRR